MTLRKGPDAHGVVPESSAADEAAGQRLLQHRAELSDCSSQGISAGEDVSAGASIGTSEAEQAAASSAAPEAIRLNVPESAAIHHGPTYVLTKPVFLIGFMGAGKTSVARRLARVCGTASIDMDTYLQRWAQRSIAEIFDQEGEDGFRRIETAVLREIMGMGSLVVSCGGGVVTQEENRVLLQDAGFVVHLRVTADEARNRISNIKSRPLFADQERATQLNEERMPLYSELADATVATGDRNVGSIAAEVKRILVNRGVLVEKG